MTKKQKQKTKQVLGWCSGLKMFLWYLHQQIYFIKATSPPSLLFSLSLFAPVKNVCSVLMSIKQKLLLFTEGIPIPFCSQNRYVDLVARLN